MFPGRTKPKLVEPMGFESTYNMITKELCGAPWPSMVSNKEEFLVPPCCPQKTRYHMFNSDTLPSRRFPDLPSVRGINFRSGSVNLRSCKLSCVPSFKCLDSA